MIKATIQNSPYATEMTFPCTETQLSKWLDELRMNPEHLCPAATVTQIEPSELSVLEDCEVSLDALNYLAKRLDGMDELECKQFFAALTCDEVNIGYGLKNIINLTFNLDRFTLIENTDDLEKVGRTHMLNIRGGISTSELENKEWLIEEGKKLLDSRKGIQNDYGLLFVNEGIKFEDFFEGTVFPQYLCDPDAVMSVEIDYGSRIETVELPCEEIAIKKALFRLGAENIRDCHLMVDTFKDIHSEWQDRFLEFEKTRDIFGLNNLLKNTDIRLEQPPSVFMTEVERKLRSEGYDVTKDGDFLVISQGDRAIACVNDIRLINATNNNSDEEYLKIKSTVRNINDYCEVFEKAPLLNANGLSGDYHCLSEFNGTVLAAKNTTLGFEFVTWERTFDGKGVTQGNYYTNYLAAKENFAVRSGLVDKHKMFDVAELADIRKCVNFVLENDGNLHFDEYNELKKLSEKISEIVPEQRQSDAPEMSMGGV
ncbi:MAG: hypothetical protein NC299_16905 [Lachnospiraceae bacterium]|nr:hypothetical protein [Ruminococcus sp.]MCM1277011.1 hypothetical protein [Lachnospiraceae bacterium]